MIMKKNILYLVALVGVLFAACNPLKDEINNLKPVVTDKTLALTLATADYGLLPSANYAQKGQYFATTADANSSIPVILNVKYPQLGNGTKANVVYNSLALQIKPADSLLTSIAYTVTDADYAATNGNAFKNFSAANVLKFLATKYPAAVDKQLSVLSYVYFESGATSSAGVPVTDTFIFLNNEWIKAYQVSQAQYISAGKLTLFNFAAADEANLTGFFNAFLKADAAVAAKAKVGDIKYVSFAYFASNRTYQRIKTLVFDGLNWVTKAIPSAPLAFLKKNGTWIPDPTVYYTLVAADYTNIADNAPSAIGNTANRANLKQFRNFNMAAGQSTSWTAADVEAALIFVLNAKFAAAAVDPTVNYKISFIAYNGSSTGPVEKIFVKGTAGFVVAPAQ